MWNPYNTLPARQKQLLAFGTVAVVLLIWSVLSGAGIIGPNKLPAPWTVGATFVRMISPDLRWYAAAARRQRAKHLVRRMLGNRLYHGLYKSLSAG